MNFCLYRPEILTAFYSLCKSTKVPCLSPHYLVNVIAEHRGCDAHNYWQNEDCVVIGVVERYAEMYQIRYKYAYVHADAEVHHRLFTLFWGQFLGDQQRYDRETRRGKHPREHTHNNHVTPMYRDGR